jgi:hypothetical protein
MAGVVLPAWLRSCARLAAGPQRNLFQVAQLKVWHQHQQPIMQQLMHAAAKSRN